MSTLQKSWELSICRPWGQSVKDKEWPYVDLNAPNPDLNDPPKDISFFTLLTSRSIWVLGFCDWYGHLVFWYSKYPKQLWFPSEMFFIWQFYGLYKWVFWFSSKSPIFLYIYQCHIPFPFMQSMQYFFSF